MYFLRVCLREPEVTGDKVKPVFPFLLNIKTQKKSHYLGILVFSLFTKYCSAWLKMYAGFLKSKVNFEI